MTAVARASSSHPTPSPRSARRGAYVYWALTTDASIVYANAVAPGGVPDGLVNVYVIGASGQPVSNDVVLKLLTLYQTADVVPLTDVPSVINATVISYDLNLKRVIARGPDPTLIKTQAAAAVRAYAQSVYKLGQTAYANALLASARVGGVLNVTSDSIQDVVCDGTQVPWLRNLTITSQDETDTTSGSGTPEPVLDGGSF